VYVKLKQAAHLAAKQPPPRHPGEFTRQRGNER